MVCVSSSFNPVVNVAHLSLVPTDQRSSSPWCWTSCLACSHELCPLEPGEAQWGLQGGLALLHGDKGVYGGEASPEDPEDPSWQSRPGLPGAQQPGTNTAPMQGQEESPHPGPDQRGSEPGRAGCPGAGREAGWAAVPHYQLWGAIRPALQQVTAGAGPWYWLWFKGARPAALRGWTSAWCGPLQGLAAPWQSPLWNLVWSGAAGENCCCFMLLFIRSCGKSDKPWYESLHTERFTDVFCGLYMNVSHHKHIFSMHTNIKRPYKREITHSWKRRLTNAYLDVVTFISRLLNPHLLSACHLWTLQHLCVGVVRLPAAAWFNSDILKRESSLHLQMSLSFADDRVSVNVWVLFHVINWCYICIMKRRERTSNSCQASGSDVI